MTALAPHIAAFLHQRLPAEQGASEHTRDSYSYAFQLLFTFAGYGPWTMEFAAAAMFFTDNDDFFDGNRLSQDPIYSLQGHLVHSFHSGIWVSIDATWFAGGRTTLNGVLNNDLQQNWRFGGTVAFPIDRANSVKLSPPSPTPATSSKTS